MGRLGLVQAPNKEPRLVMDSSVSGLNAITAAATPNAITMPSTHSVKACGPVEPGQETSSGLVIDIGKAHKRILLREPDRGLMSCEFHSRIFCYKTLNFGARCAQIFIYVQHHTWIYVDDWLWRFPTASIWHFAALVLLLLELLQVPLSYHKINVAEALTWIGWQLDFSLWTISLPDAKRLKIWAFLNRIISDRQISCRDLEAG